ncbi:mechanosensitive ion channel family protein [Thiocystis violacea]|uniref:mechanosensitive ion channel family protein n=1 Tax=Thiocystis violacea TaxID=13725 RepID=UPI0019033759|nr:mechanosensitive ion channel family protein [Thiocystis violacea]MBK1724179.1 mechanosensitive ion channel protein MscS [Thiocystis violacea]
MKPIELLTEQLMDIARGVLASIPQVLLALFLLILTFAVAKIVRAIMHRALRKARLRRSLKNLATLLSSIAVWTFGLMLAALVAFPHLTPTKVLAALGIGSVAIGFAFKDVFENFLAGIIILLRQEMRIGDFIALEGIEGRVESISVRETHIRQTDDQLVIVPNSLLFKNPLTILTDRDQRRTTIVCGIAYAEDVDEAREIIRSAVASCEGVLTDAKPIEVFAQEFADSSINFEVTWWTGSTPLDVRRSRDAVVSAVKRALDDAGIEIPFPYRTLTFGAAVPVRLSNSED